MPCHCLLFHDIHEGVEKLPASVGMDEFFS